MHPLEHINWYRGKMSEMTSHSLMKQEFPSDHIEAFQDSGMPAFRSEDVEAMRKECMPPEFIGTIEADAMASSAKAEPQNRKKILTNVNFISESFDFNADPKSRLLKERNKLKIWISPDEMKLKDRFVVVVDTGGRSEKADYSVN